MNRINFEFIHCYWSRKDRELLKNIAILRNYVKDMIKERRTEMKKDNYQDKGDLLTIFLHDEIFANNDDRIIDECLTFFFAGS